MALPLTHEERVAWLMEEVERARIELRWKAAQLSHELKVLTDSREGRSVDSKTARPRHPTRKYPTR